MKTRQKTWRRSGGLFPAVFLLLCRFALFSVLSLEAAEAENPFPPPAKSKPLPEAAKSKLEFSKEGLEKAMRHLKNVLKKYYRRSLHVKLKREIHISALQRTDRDMGAVYIQKEKFRISMDSNARELMIFDGSILWLQPEKRRKRQS